MLHISNGAIHEVEPREQTRKEGQEYKYFNTSVVMLVFFIYLKLMQPITITVQKSTGGFRFDYATYWDLTVKEVV